MIFCHKIASNWRRRPSSKGRALERNPEPLRGRAGTSRPSPRSPQCNRNKHLSEWQNGCQTATEASADQQSSTAPSASRGQEFYVDKEKLIDILI